MNGILLLASTIATATDSVSSINEAASSKGLPPVFNTGNGSIHGNPDYRFEGFGVSLARAIPPKPQLNFYIHYKIDSPHHVELGRFSVPIGIGKLSRISSASDEIGPISGSQINS